MARSASRSGASTTEERWEQEPEDAVKPQERLPFGGGSKENFGWGESGLSAIRKSLIHSIVLRGKRKSAVTGHRFSCEERDSRGERRGIFPCSAGGPGGRVSAVYRKEREVSARGSSNGGLGGFFPG